MDVLWVPKFVPSLSPSPSTVSGPGEQHKPVLPGLVRGSCPFQSHPISQCWGDAQPPFEPPLRTARSLPGYRPTCEISLCPSYFFFFFLISDLKIRFPVKTWISGFRTRWEVSAPPRAAAGWRPRSLAGSCVRPWAAVPTAPRPLTPTASLCSCPWCRGHLGGLTTGCGSRLPGLGDSCFQGTPLDPAGEPVSRTAPCACA